MLISGTGEEERLLDERVSCEEVRRDFCRVSIKKGERFCHLSLIVITGHK
jgi:hypothetical protein